MAKKEKQIEEMTHGELVAESCMLAEEASKFDRLLRRVLYELKRREVTKPDPKLTLKQIREYLFDFTRNFGDVDEEFDRVINTLKARFPTRKKMIDKIYERHENIMICTSKDPQYDAMVERYTDFIYRLTK